MRSSTIVLQIFCVVLGILFIAAAFFLKEQVLVGGLLLGSLMCMCAAFLGADHTTNSGKSRGVFKVLAAIASLPLLIVGFQAAVMSYSQSDWTSALFTSLKLLVVVVVLVLLAIDTTPAGKKFLSSIGLSNPSTKAE
jgi:hypothetical protein